MSSDEYPVLRRGKLQAYGSLRVEGVLGGLGIPLFVLGSQRLSDTAEILKLTLTPTPLGDPGSPLNPGDVLVECRVSPKDQSRVEPNNILRAFEVIRSKLAGDQSYTRLVEVRQILPASIQRPIKTDSEPEQVSLSQFRVQPWEVLLVKVKHEDSKVVIDQASGGSMFAISGLWVNTFGTYGGNLRFVDGFSKLDPRTLLRQVESVTLENGEYLASSGAAFEVIFSRPGTLSDLAIQLRQTSSDKIALHLPPR